MVDVREFASPEKGTYQGVVKPLMATYFLKKIAIVTTSYVIGTSARSGKGSSSYGRKWPDIVPDLWLGVRNRILIPPTKNLSFR